MTTQNFFLPFKTLFLIREVKSLVWQQDLTFKDTFFLVYSTIPNIQVLWKHWLKKINVNQGRGIHKSVKKCHVFFEWPLTPKYWNTWTITESCWAEVVVLALDDRVHVPAVVLRRNSDQSCVFAAVDSLSQFHQHFTVSFFNNTLSPIKLQRQNLVREKLLRSLSYKKLLVKCWCRHQFQYHQHFMSSFCVKILSKKITNLKLKKSTWKLQKKLLYEKELLIKCWWNWQLFGTKHNSACSHCFAPAVIIFCHSFSPRKPPLS